MPDVNVKGRYRIYTHDGTTPLNFATTYSNQLCSIRRPNPNTFITISQYVPGSLSPFTTFDPGSSYTIVTRDNTANFSMGPYTRVDRLPSSVTFKTPNFYHGLDKNSITVAISSYASSAGSPLSTVFCYIPNQDGYSINSISFDTARYRDGLPSLLTHLTPNSSYQFKTRTPFTFFAPLQSEMGDAYASGDNTSGQYGMGHRFTDPKNELPGENIYGVWDKIVFSYGTDVCVDSNNLTVYATSIAALSSCGTSKALFVLGSNLYGQLGTGSTKQYYATWTRVPGQWQDICLGVHHMLATNSLGHLYACGDNTYGQLGIGSGTANTNTLTLVDNTRTYIELAAHTQCTMVRTTNNFLYACGKNDTGQLGIGNTTSPTYTLTREVLGYTWTSVKANPPVGYFVAISNNKLYGVTTGGMYSYYFGNVTNTPSAPYAFTQEDLNLTDVTRVEIGRNGTFIQRENQNAFFTAGNSGGILINRLATLSGNTLNYFTKSLVPSDASVLISGPIYFYYIQSTYYAQNILYRKSTGSTFTPRDGNFFNMFSDNSTLFVLSARNDLRPTPTPTLTPTPTPAPTPVPGVDKFALIAQDLDQGGSRETNHWSQIWEYTNNDFATPTKILALNNLVKNATQGYQPQDISILSQTLFDYEKGAYSNLIAVVSDGVTGTRRVYRCTTPSTSTWTLISTPAQLNFCSGYTNVFIAKYTSLGDDLLFIDKNNTYYYYSWYCGYTDTTWSNAILYVSSSTDRGVTWTAQTVVCNYNTFLNNPPNPAKNSIWGSAMKAVQDSSNTSNHKLFFPLQDGSIAQYSPGLSPSKYINDSAIGPFDVICDSDGTFHEAHIKRDPSSPYVDGYSLFLNGNIIVPYDFNKFAVGYSIDWGSLGTSTNSDRNRRGGFLSLAKRGNIYYILYARRAAASTLGSASTLFDRTGIGLIEYNSQTNTYTDTFIAGRQFDGSPLFTFDNTRYPINTGTSPTGLLVSLKLLLNNDGTLIAFCTVGELVGFLDGRNCIYSFKRDPATKVWTKLSGPNNYLTSSYTNAPGPYHTSFAFYSTRYK
jgi:hypothetical protein